MLAAHRSYANPEHRKEVAAFWGVPSVSERPGLTATQMIESAISEISARSVATAARPHLIEVSVINVAVQKGARHALRRPRLELLCPPIPASRN